MNRLWTDAELERVLSGWIQSWTGDDRSQLPKPIQDELVQFLLAERRYPAFAVAPAAAPAAVHQRASLLQQVYSPLAAFCHQLTWKELPLALIWNLWLPLALQIAAWHHDQQPLVQGILGGQGTGKTTLTAALALILQSLGLRVCRLSIDDLYKTYADRQQLQQSDPRLRWRGPPGTHDIELGLEVLQQLRAQRASVAVPRFDKSAQGGAGDRATPEPVQGADVVLFEGWFVGARPVDAARFDQAPAPILTEADRIFARDSNCRLQAYLPLWNEIDRLVVLHPSDYRFSQQWRRQAEQQMIATGRSGMSDAEIDQFVEYFWKALHPELFILPLVKNSAQASLADRASLSDLAIELNVDHQPIRVYRP